MYPLIAAALQITHSKLSKIYKIKMTVCVRYEKNNDSVHAVIETLHTAGRAMLVTTCVLSIGFFIFMFAEMRNLFDFGRLTGFTIIMALLADYFIAPALMVVANRKKSE